MKKLNVFSILLLISALVILFFVTNKEQSPSPFIIEGFSKTNKQIIEKAAKKWVSGYGNIRNIKFVTFHGETKPLPDGATGITRETSFPGLIKIDQDGIGSSDYGKKEMYDTVLHAMTHAAVVNVITLPKPIPFCDGYILGYKGASIKVRLKNGTGTFWGLMEEGICERNAAAFGGYSVENEDYFAIGNLARRHFPAGTDTMRYVRESNVPGLIGLILKKDPNLVSVQDIENVMRMYQSVLHK